MKVDVKKIERGQVEITIELTEEEYRPHLEAVAKKISENTKIDGFRPGKASYDLIEKKVGKNEVWQQAIEGAVNKTFIQAIEQEKLITVGSPNIEVIKLAPDNPVIYKAVVAILPTVQLGDLSKIKVDKKDVTVDQITLERSLENLRKMRAKEVLVDRKSKDGDKLEINFETFMDKVPIDNGKQDKFLLVLGEKTFIPGFEENIVGLGKDDEKKFKLTFPKEYHQKNLAGREADFKVKVNAVYDMQLPQLNDALAQSVGDFKTVKDLEEQLRKNLQEEADHKEDHRIEESIIDQVIKNSTFDEVPDILISSEAKKMVEELEQNVSRQGIKFDDYLLQIKKTKADLLLDFTPQAINRVKSAVALRKIGQDAKIDVTEDDVQAEIKKTLMHYSDHPEAEKQLNIPEYRNYLKNIIASRKIIEHLKEIVVK